MPVSLRSAIAPAVLALLLSGQAGAAPVTAEAIEAASYTGGALPSGQSALTAKVQVMLDRAGTSPGVIDSTRVGSRSTE